MTIITTTRLLFLASLASISILASGCSPRYQVFTADEFHVLEEGYDYDFRATTADGLVIALREIENPQQNTSLKFWTQAIENKLRLDSGYALLNTKTIETASGLKGSQMRFGTDRDQGAHVYIVTAFLTEKYLYILEAGGTEAQVAQHQAQLDWTVQNFSAH